MQHSFIITTVNGRVANLLSRNSSWSKLVDWNHTLLQFLYPTESIQEISQLPICINNDQDCKIWSLGSIGNYSAKEGFQFLNSQNGSGIENNFWKFLCSISLPNKSYYSYGNSCTRQFLLLISYKIITCKPLRIKSLDALMRRLFPTCIFITCSIANYLRFHTLGICLQVTNFPHQLPSAKRMDYEYSSITPWGKQKNTMPWHNYTSQFSIARKELYQAPSRETRCGKIQPWLYSKISNNEDPRH